MRAIAIGGSGPREHVSYEQGPVAEVVPWLQTSFRNAFPGQQTVPGALYFRPDDERWIWIIVRQPHVGGRIAYGENSQIHRFAYFTPMKVQDELLLPEISVFWGRGLDQAERVLAEQFDCYEEPPEWWWNTTWFWLHPMWQKDSTFEQSQKAVEILMDKCGVTGFGLGIHDIPWSGRDIDFRSPRACPRMGAEDNLKRLCDTINSKGGHSFMWTSRTAMYPAGDYRDRWAIRGEDGRRCMLNPRLESGVKLNVINCMDRDFLQYFFDWVRRYVCEIGVQGLFWDSGMQPMPPDFTDREDIECPGEGMVVPQRFYEKIYRYGRSLSSDFFMWVEGISTEMYSNAFAVDNSMHGGKSGHPLMHRIANLGPRRLVWRSAWPHHLAGAFPYINPVADIGRDPGPQTYEKIAADPMNRWICETVKARGLRQATGIGDGISVLDEFVVACPKITGATLVPEALVKGENLTHEISAATVKGKKQSDGSVLFDLPESGAWKMT